MRHACVPARACARRRRQCGGDHSGRGSAKVKPSQGSLRPKGTARAPPAEPTGRRLRAPARASRAALVAAISVVGPAKGLELLYRLAFFSDNPLHHGLIQLAHHLDSPAFNIMKLAPLLVWPRAALSFPFVNPHTFISTAPRALPGLVTLCQEHAKGPTQRGVTYFSDYTIRYHPKFCFLIPPAGTATAALRRRGL